MKETDKKHTLLVLGHRISCSALQSCGRSRLRSQNLAYRLLRIISLIGSQIAKPYNSYRFLKPAIKQKINVKQGHFPADRLLTPASKIQKKLIIQNINAQTLPLSINPKFFKSGISPKCWGGQIYHNKEFLELILQLHALADVNHSYKQSV